MSYNENVFKYHWNHSTGFLTNIWLCWTKPLLWWWEGETKEFFFLENCIESLFGPVQLLILLFGIPVLDYYIYCIRNIFSCSTIPCFNIFPFYFLVFSFCFSFILLFLSSFFWLLCIFHLPISFMHFGF